MTLGGASVGDHDLVQTALTREGMELGFWRIAMRPGKPFMHGRIGDMRILGLPGNPVSAIVCGLIYLIPLVRKLSGDPDPAPDLSEPAILGVDMKANDQRQDFLRATFSRDEHGRTVATPHAIQDSSLLSVFTRSQALLLRPPYAPAAKAGDECRILRLRHGGFYTPASSVRPSLRGALATKQSIHRDSGDGLVRYARNDGSEIPPMLRRCDRPAPPCHGTTPRVPPALAPDVSRLKAFHKIV